MSFPARRTWCQRNGHMYGHRSECMFCGHVVEEQDAPLNCQSGSPFNAEERRFGDRLLMGVIAVVVLTLSWVLS